MSDPSNAPPPAAPDDGNDALRPGTRLAEFEIREVLGAGGFGIVYRAWDDALQRDVALKEYMPASLAGRGAGQRVTLRTSHQGESFALGLQSFVNEARLLARFDQPALVKVFRFWEGNGTAYMAMPLYKGRNLRQLRKERGSGTFDDAWTRALIEPLLGALEAMHAADVYHRDIAPDNILWCDDNRPVLLDFGAARLVLADRTQNVTAILKPQFAPIEQYAETQSMRQGPWTDLYALAGTCYFLLTGRAPLPATARVMGDELEPLARLAPAGCSPQLLQVLDWAMAVRPQDRPQSVAQFRDALAGRIAVPLRAAARAPAAAIDQAAGSSAYEPTIQATMHVARTERMPAASAPAAPATRERREQDLETPERSVLLPPKSASPLKALVLILLLGAAAAGAWTTRAQWMPAVGLQAALPATEGAPAVDTLASASPASATVAEPAPAASATASSPAGDAAASAAEPAASEADPTASAPVNVAAEDTAPSRPARSKSANARNKALEARIAALTMPPPVLPPPLASPAATDSHAATAAPAPDTPAPAAAPATRAHGWREVCTDQEPAKIAACLKRLCDDDARYPHYAVCQRVRRQEQLQQRGGSE